MANPKQLTILKQGVSKWNNWRKNDKETLPDLQRAALFQANLVGAYLRKVNLSGADLSGANLGKADMSKAYLSNANLSNANLRGANLNSATLNGAYLSGANLRDATMSGTYLRGAYLSGASLSGADLTGADLTGADLTGADLTGANLRATNFTDVILSESQEELLDRHRLYDPESPVIVSINLPQKKIGLIEKESILRAIGELMKEMGFAFKGDEEPIHGSFFQRLLYVFKNPNNKREVKEIYQKGKQALEEEFLNKPSSESTENLAIAAASLLSALEKVDEGVVRLGRIIVVKVLHNDKTKVAIQTVSPRIAAELDNNPSLEKNPLTIFNLLLEKTTNPVIQEKTMREINE